MPSPPSSSSRASAQSQSSEDRASSEALRIWRPSLNLTHESAPGTSKQFKGCSTAPRRKVRANFYGALPSFSRPFRKMRRPFAQLALLLLPAITLGIRLDGENCPPDAETKLCSASQDFVVVIDVSFSRRPYFEEFKKFLLAFFAEIGLEGTDDDDGPRVSVVSFQGAVFEDTTKFWTDDQSTTHLPLSSSRPEVENFVTSLADPKVVCTEAGGCTCISCGANVAWAQIPVGKRDGAPPPLFRRPTRPPPRLTASSLHQPPRCIRAPFLHPL